MYKACKTMALHPSLTGFLAHTIVRFKLVRYGENILHRLSMLYLAVLYSTPKFIRRRLPLLDRRIEELCSTLARKTVVNVNGIKFALIDYESMRIVLPELHEKWMWDYLKVKSGGVFLDVGAHVGKYVLQIARDVGENGLIIAIEPNPENYAVLVKNIRMNKIENILALNIAAWNEDCKIELFTGVAGGQHSLKRKAKLGSVVIEARALDNVLKGIDVDLVKIDVEEAEVEVLQGLENTLKKCRPKVVMETFETNLETVKKFMIQLGYNIMPIHASEFEKGIYLYCRPQNS